MSNLKARDSGIELLKIFAMLIIISSHWVQTLSNYKINGELMLDLTMTGQGITNSIIAAFLYNGNRGNFIFFACSAWFLVNSNKVNKRKMLSIVLDVWAISVIMLITTLVINRDAVSIFEIIRNLLPTTYQNNWYITCYLLFYAIHPLLNSIINGMTQKQHLRTVFMMIVLYYFWSFFLSIFSGGADFFGNNLVLWSVLYFIIAYVKIYMPKFNSNKKINIILLAVAVIGHYGLIFGTNIFKLISGIFTDKMQVYNKGNNPFIILMAISLVNIAKEIRWKNAIINYVAGLSLFIYVIHENWFVRSYLRPYVWDKIFAWFGYDHIIMWIVVMTLVTFMVSMLLATIYKSTIHKLISKVSCKIYNLVCPIYRILEKQLLKLN